MANKGFSHIRLSTLDLDKTIEFYQDVLGFLNSALRRDPMVEGGSIRHAIMDSGRDQLVAFMESRDVPGIPKD